MRPTEGCESGLGNVLRRRAAARSAVAHQSSSHTTKPSTKGSEITHDKLVPRAMGRVALEEAAERRSDEASRASPGVGTLPLCQRGLGMKLEEDFELLESPFVG